MQARSTTKLQTGLIWLGLGLLALLLLNSPGTSDMGIPTWSDNLERLGLVHGFAANHADYPPLTSAILLGAVRLGELVDVRPFVAIKLSILTFLGLTCLACWRWTKDMRVTAALFLALLLNSALLAYVDIYLAPALVLGLWALKEERLELFSLCFGAACLTKWQPLIIAPFLLVYILGQKQGSTGWRLARAALPAAGSSGDGLPGLWPGAAVAGLQGFAEPHLPERQRAECKLDPHPPAARLLARDLRRVGGGPSGFDHHW